MGRKNKMRALVLAVAMVMGVLSGCGVSVKKDGSDDTKQDQTQNQTKEDSKADSGGGQITLRIIDWSDSAASIRKEFNEEYMKNNPNIKIEYTMMTIDQFKTAVITQIKSGDAPDLFPIPSGMSLSAAMQEYWYTPMNDYIPAEFWDTVNDGILLEGIAKIGDSYYTIPEVMPITNSLIYYNKDLLDAAGVTELPKTYSQFLEANKKITEAGKGQFYGFIEGGKQLNRLHILANAFANVAGAQLPQYSKALTVGGRINYDSDAVINTFALFKQLYEGGSIHPDTVNLDAPTAREYFAQGQAAFLMQGNWCISVWDANNPDLNYGVMAVPAPDDGAKGALPNEIPAPWMGIYSQSKYPQEAADYLMALYSYADGYSYQENLVSEAGQLSIVKGIVEENLSNEHAVEYYNLAKEVCLTIPAAEIRDNKVYDFYAAVIDVQPSFPALFQGVISGGLNDYETALTTLSDNITNEWKRAADEVGLDISALEFDDWNPGENYQN